MIEQINATTYEMSMPSGDKVEIGGRDNPDFKPHLKLNRFKGECSLSEGLPDDFTGVLATIEGDKISWVGKWDKSDVWADFYPSITGVFPLGGYHSDIIIGSKPSSNKLYLPLNLNGLKAFHQPALTQQEIEEGCIRPEEIVNSFAIYHATKGGMVTPQDVAKGITTGKAFHALRRKVVDAKRNWVWVHSELVNGHRVLTIPQEFLEYASYPIILGTPSEYTWYFRTYDGTEKWETNPQNMVDGNLASYAVTNNADEVQKLSQLYNAPIGSIVKVEVRAYGYTAGDEKVYLRPIFSAGDGDNHEWALPASAGWSSYYDITNDTNAPASWAYSDLDSLAMDVQYIGVGKKDNAYIAKIEIRITANNDTFGYTTIGGSSGNTASIGGCLFTIGEDGDATQITSYASGYGGDRQGAAAIYNDSSGDPTTKVAEDDGNITLLSGVLDWYVNNITASLTGSTPYWLCAWSDDSRTYHYDAGVANQRFYRSYTFENWPDELTDEVFSARKVSIYCTYTSGGPPAEGIGALYQQRSPFGLNIQTTGGR